MLLTNRVGHQLYPSPHPEPSSVLAWHSTQLLLLPTTNPRTFSCLGPVTSVTAFQLLQDFCWFQILRYLQSKIMCFLWMAMRLWQMFIVAFNAQICKDERIGKIWRMAICCRSTAGIYVILNILIHLTLFLWPRAISSRFVLNQSSLAGMTSLLCWSCFELIHGSCAS